MSLTAKLSANRALDIYGQIDASRFSLALGVHPDLRDFSMRTRRTEAAAATFIRVWAFVLVFVRWEAA